MTEAPPQKNSTTPPPSPQKPASPPPPITDPFESWTGLKRWIFFRLVVGWLLITGLTYFFWTPGDWKVQLFLWILITILADEIAGWFGYIGLSLIALIFLNPQPTPNEWFIIAPLIGGALFGLLLIKHSGKVLVLPAAGLLFLGTLFLMQKITPMLDESIKLPMNPEFQRMVILPMLIGLGFSFIRQVTVILWRKLAKQRSEQKITQRFHQAMKPIAETNTPNDTTHNKSR